MAEYINRSGLIKLWNHIKNYIDSIIRSTIANGDFATKTSMENIMKSIETNEPYLPLAGGMMFYI